MEGKKEVEFFYKEYVLNFYSVKSQVNGFIDKAKKNQTVNLRHNEYSSRVTWLKSVAHCPLLNCASVVPLHRSPHPAPVPDPTALAARSKVPVFQRALTKFNIGKGDMILIPARCQSR